MTTKHTHKPNFSRQVDGCPRCDELRNGAESVRWNTARTGGSPLYSEPGYRCPHRDIVTCTCGT